ncbi:MAG: winged helix-turn-helix transcriptional regulator [Streptosporangiaceae bacterium]
MCSSAWRTGPPVLLSPRPRGGISKKMLTVTLRRLAGSGLVDRPQVRGGDYALTALGESLMGPLTALTAWAEQHADDLAAAQTKADAV